MCGLKKKKADPMEVESRMVGAWGWGEQEEGGLGKGSLTGTKSY